MKQLLATTFLLLFAALPAASQDESASQPNDKIELLNGNIIEGVLTSISYKEISYVLQAGDARHTQQQNAREVRRIELHSSNKGYDLINAESRLQEGDYKEAAARFQAALKGGRTSSVAKQFAYHQLIRCGIALRDQAQTAAAIDSFRKEFPDTFFLLDTYVALYDLSREKGDKAGMTQAIDEIRKRGEALGLESWKAASDLKQADFHEMNRDWDKARKIYATLAAVASAKDDALLGELRCMSALNDTRGLAERSASLLIGLLKQKNPNARLLMGAYIARGDSLLDQKGKLKDALLDYLRVALDLGPAHSEPTPEYEAGLAKAAIAAARFAADPANTAGKDAYKARARQLLETLQREFGAASSWPAKVEAEIKAIP